MFKEVDYCTCEVFKVYTEQNDMGHWDVCDICKKVIEDTFEYFNYNSDDYYG
ncbi:hypothetical protein LI071_04640 [Bacillus subtilis]|uniref:hypothetical protein n=1 Tax=Bacillus subtilis TaxID=1423 RepID=UPI001D066D9D|nr:hypothetical protein [Bacillus subtilis]MCB7159960.1 hypothetical protein [Bacillus subtilis]MCB7459042.1 hypothetical protein [Bacillus subtilis]